MGKVADQVFQLVEPIAESFGLVLLEVLYEKKYDGMNLTIVIDKDDGYVDINDCERLHKAIDAPLDELDPIDCTYTLNVSSAGIDRPLKTQRDFKRNLNKKISVKLYKAINGKKNFVGILVAYDEETFTISPEKGENITFVKKETAHIEPVIEF